MEFEMKHPLEVQGLCKYYPAFRLDMDVFTARIVSGEPVATEHESMLWADRETLAETLFCPADVGIAEKIRNLPDEAWDAE